ncbi:MAG TPA: DUF4351 domain-containing protein [Nodularia sp. (in: cyanobacteria)]|nr:DUF4351 domain-containing protein [Nodularia sp. (in: cyanobacteria)]
MIDHDRLFKELISNFFLEFIELFFPELRESIEPESVKFLDKEVFTDVTEGKQYETDLVAQVQLAHKSAYFLIHIENESSARANFNRRMFRYFARLHEKFNLPIYPIVIFSYDRPKKAAVNQYQVGFPDFQVLEFNYRVIQLNQYNWRDFLSRPNPVASALMAKMNIAPSDRPKVKAECLRLLVTLKLNPAKMQLISGFIDTYLSLNQQEETVFKSELGLLEPQEQEEVMQIVTSWMRQGIEQGAEREKDLIIRLIKRKLGEIDRELESRIRSYDLDIVESLGEELWDFSTVEDLRNWLDNTQNQVSKGEIF